jgi:hypothetical protein
MAKLELDPEMANKASACRAKTELPTVKAVPVLQDWKNEM